MLKNYLKITFAVLKRRKFFTFISLFGISFTLVVLIVLTAFIDHMVASGYPELKRERLLYVSRIEMRDTKQGYFSGSNISFSFIKNYVQRLTDVEKIGFSTESSSINTYVNHQKIKLDFMFTDANFWQISDFEFLEGKAYNELNINNNDYVAIINDATRENCFGKGVSAVGKMIDVDNVTYRIIGVVRGCPISRRFTSADIYMPYTTNKLEYKSSPLQGGFMAMILANSSDDFPKIKAEFQGLISKIPKSTMQQGDFKPDKLNCFADTFLGTTAAALMQAFHIDGDGDSGIKTLYLILMAFALLFMSLPAINLVNINISRIMERASEIGIRKAFGATSNTLTIQFVIENIMLTLIGGMLSILLSWGIIFFINNSGLIPYIDLSINWKVFLVAFVVSLIFGLLSGVYPAWRMSKLQVVEALKN